MARRANNSNREIESYAHAGQVRANNPPVGLVTPETDPDESATDYSHDPHIDPCLSWAGKAGHTTFEVPTVSLHVHERIDPRTIIEAVRKRNGAETPLSLFDIPGENPPIRQAIEFYKHRHNWSNRLIAGDSLLVMNSLLEKEGLGGKVQTAYIDPPYGIRYASNFQPFVNQKQLTEGKDEDLTREPEQIRAFRDTWELGIHSYLTYLRDRLLLARDLLTESGSCFVQIGDENVHRVGLLMDEVFGAGNRIATISFATTSGSSAGTLPEVADYLLWYAKDRKNVKYRQLYEGLSRQEIVKFFSSYVMVELPDGTCRKLTKEEEFDPDRLPPNSRIYQRRSLDSQGESKTGRSDPYVWANRTFPCSPGRQWSISEEGLDRLAQLGRLDSADGQATLRWKNYEDEVPGRRINNLWPDQMSERGSSKRYVVQTAVKPIQRAVLMTSDPGDLVFDPTCGAGTTAFVAEQWGRRWITCDTSRISIAIARQRLMTASFEFYELAHPNEGVGGGLRYKSVDSVSASTLGYAEPAKVTQLYDDPIVDSSKARVTGPFTVEAVPAPVVKPIDDSFASDPIPADNSLTRTGETVRQEDWRDELLKTGIRGKSGQRLSFSRLEPLPGMRWIHADGEIRSTSAGSGGADCSASHQESQRIVVSFGPDHAPLEQRQVELAIGEARQLIPQPQVIVYAAFQFDPEASKDIDELKWGGVALLKAQMNADLLTADLKKKRASNESFWLIGQPDIVLEQIHSGNDEGKYRISVQGFDYFNTRTGKLESGGVEKIALWMFDPDYDGRSIFARQVFFPMAGAKDGWGKLAKSLRAEIDADLIEAFRGTVSLPFDAGEHERAAVKIVDDRGIESLKIVALK